MFAQVTVATLLAWAITRWLRHGRVRQWCWRTVFVLSGCWLIASALGVERMTRTADAAPASERQLVIRNNLPVENALVEPRQVLSVVEEPRAVSTETVAHAAAGPVWWPAIVWVGVGMLFGLRAVFGQLLIAWYSRRLDRGISPGLASLVELAAERLEVDDRVSVRVIPELVSPITHGWWRVSIALPSRFEQLYTREQQERRRVRHLLAWRGEGWRPRPSRSQVTTMALVGMAAMGLGLFAPALLLPRLHAEGPSLLEHVVAAVARDAEADSQHVDDGTDQADGGPVAVEPDPVAALPESTLTEHDNGDPASIEGLQTRSYRIDYVYRLRQAFEEMTSGQSASPDLAIALRQYLTAAGVEFGMTNALVALGSASRAWQSPTGRSFLFNELNGRLLIRATAAEHELVLQALELLLPVPQQITIEARFYEVTEPLRMPAAQLGFDWFLGNTLVTSETNGPAPPTNTATGVRTDPVFSDLPGRATVSEVRGDELDWAGRSDPDAHRMRVEQVTEIPAARVIDDAQRALLDQVLKQNSADLLAAPRVTTLSSRLTQISLIETRTLVVGIKPDAVVTDGKPPDSQSSSGPFRTAALPFGPVLEVTPTASADSPMIELDVKFALTQFIRYEPESSGDKVLVWDHGRKTQVMVPVSSFRIRQMNTHATLPDGQTLLMTGGTIDEPIRTKDKVPTLGDLPLVGRWFRSEHDGTIQKRLFVLITATRIDPAGNPLRPVASARTPEAGLDR